MKEAIILAGGFGTRLQSVVKDVPKPMAEVNKRPFLAYLLDNLEKQGLQKVVLSVGYKYEVIQDYFGDHYKGLAIQYAIEKTPLGTGGAILLGQQYCTEKSFLVLNGDTFFDVSIAKLEALHQLSGADLTIAARAMENFDRYGTVTFDPAHGYNYITGFQEKQWQAKGFINGGIYLMDHQLLPSLSLSERFSFEKEVLETYYKHPKYQFAACPFEADTYFIDIGIPEDYARANEDLR